MAFPKMLYQRDGTTTIVRTDAELAALSGGWFDSPADFGYLSAPSVDQLDEGTATPYSYAPNGVQVPPISGVG